MFRELTLLSLNNCFYYCAHTSMAYLSLPVCTEAEYTQADNSVGQKKSGKCNGTHMLN